MQIYTVTAFGIGIDTVVKTFTKKPDAHKWIFDYMKEIGMDDFELMCTDCWKGFSGTAQCDVEIEVHRTEVEIPENRIEDAKRVLADNGIEKDETETVLQAIGYTLLDAELFPEK